MDSYIALLLNLISYILSLFFIQFHAWFVFLTIAYLIYFYSENLIKRTNFVFRKDHFFTLDFLQDHTEWIFESGLLLPPPLNILEKWLRNSGKSQEAT